MVEPVKPIESQGPAEVKFDPPVKKGDPSLGEGVSLKEGKLTASTSESGIYYSLTEKSFNGPGFFSYPIAHESMGFAFGHYQNCMLSKLPGKLRFTIPRAEIICRNSATMSHIPEELKKMGPEQKIKLNNFFKDKTKEFLQFRFNPTNCLLICLDTDEDSKTLDDIDTTTESSLKGILELCKALNAEKIEFVEYLKQILHAAYNRCKKYTKVENNHVNYSKNWNEYMATVLELDIYFKPIADIINEISDAILTDKNVPRFNIYRVLVGLFINICYRSYRSNISNYLAKELEILNNYTIRFYTIKFTQDKCQEEKNNKAMEYFEDEKTLNEFLKPLGGLENKEMRFDVLISKIRSLCDYVNAILDMYINEVNVHYIRGNSFFYRIGEPYTLGEIKDSIKEKFESACTAISNNEHMKIFKAKLVAELAYHYRLLFPPCLLEEFLERAESEELNTRVGARIDEYTKLDATKKSELAKRASDNLNKNNTEEEKNISKKLKLTGKNIIGVASEMNKDIDELGENPIAEYILEKEPSILQTLLENDLRKSMETLFDNAMNSNNDLIRGTMDLKINAKYSMEGMTETLRESIKPK